ncbi:hypothetical protein AX17_001751 [Amanita inopinata Kibby_2008]|nr:hypothetical protein AX17_001751 [Amanita inopinata Kibby_2008]
MSHNRNPTGKNQHGPVPTTDDADLVDALHSYHREKLTNNQKISARLLSDHGIKMCQMAEAEQLVLDQMDKDPSRRQGIRTIQAKIAFETEKHLTRDFVSEVMHTHDDSGFQFRDPSAKKIFRVQKVPIGIHERWSGDGHDKLYKIGFPIWAVVDDATGKWLGAWVVPSNRMGHIIGYLFLCLVETLGGIPLQFTTDCGSETTQLHGLVTALREILHPDIDIQEFPAHVYLRSVHNISIERSWLRLRLDWGDNAVIVFEKGKEDGIYNPDNLSLFNGCGQNSYGNL